MTPIRRAERYATRHCGGMGDPHWWALRDAYLAGLRAGLRAKQKPRRVYR